MTQHSPWTFNAVSECRDHHFLEKQCCGAVPKSDLVAVIDTTCYFMQKIEDGLEVQFLDKSSIG